MNYYNIDYYKLSHIKIINYFVFIIILIIAFIIFWIFGNFITINKSIINYGIIQDDVLKIKIEKGLSDTYMQNNELIFNNKIYEYDSMNFSDIEVINDNVYQTINLNLKGAKINGEFGVVKLNYEKIKLNKYILELFK